MGREVRRVPADWQHPLKYEEGPADWSKVNFRDDRALFEPLYEPDRSIRELQAEWDEERVKYEAENPEKDYSDYEGNRPMSSDYMPYWGEEERTHYQMYESTSEGTPISPVMETPEELARWLADHGASTFASFTATYEEWLPTCKGGWAPSMVIAETNEGKKVMMSGVTSMAVHKKKD